MKANSIQISTKTHWSQAHCHCIR